MPLDVNDVVLHTEDSGKNTNFESMKKTARTSSFLSYLSSVVPTLLEFEFNPTAPCGNENYDNLNVNKRTIKSGSGKIDNYNLFNILQGTIQIPQTNFLIEKFVKVSTAC